MTGVAAADNVLGRAAKNQARKEFFLISTIDHGKIRISGKQCF
jgi:hypothetical protein